MGRRRALCAPGLHHEPPERLLVEADADHVDLAFQAEEAARHGERAAPLARAGLGRQPLDAELLVIISLRHGRVGLVAAGGRDALVLVVDFRGRAQRLLQPRRAAERRRPPQPEDFEDFFRDIDPPLRRHLLLDEVHGEDRRQGLGADGLAIGADRRRHGMLVVRGDVVPLAGHFVFIEDYFDVRRHGGLPWGTVRKVEDREG